MIDVHFGKGLCYSPLRIYQPPKHYVCVVQAQKISDQLSNKEVPKDKDKCV